MCDAWSGRSPAPRSVDFGVIRGFHRPAWDHECAIRKVEAEKEYGYRARVVWKKFVSPEDCLREYQSFLSATDR